MNNELNELSPEQQRMAHYQNVVDNPDDYPESSVSAAQGALDDQQKIDANAADVAAKTNEDGTPKSTYQTLDAKEFGVKENLEDAGRALVTGVQNA